MAEERQLRQRAELAERSLRQELLLKDAAIQEVHHRVKNTLQIAASVLALQAHGTAREETRTALLEGHRRLHLLAGVHELLYRTADSAQAIAMPALIEAIGSALRQSFAEPEERVQLQVRSAAIALSADDAIALALLANEAITNAYKHAFPGQRRGKISVNLSVTPQDAIVLRIFDDGIGRPSNADAPGFGTTLIRGFAAQLKAVVAFESPADGSGTVVSVRIFDRAGIAAGTPAHQATGRFGSNRSVSRLTTA